MSDWIEHDSSGTPNLPLDTLVNVRWRYGSDDSELEPWTVGDWEKGLTNSWCDNGDSTDVIAYRVVGPHLGTAQTSQ